LGVKYWFVSVDFLTFSCFVFFFLFEFISFLFSWTVVEVLYF